MTLPLPAMGTAPGTAVELGLRPRDLVLGEPPGMVALRGRVYVVEPLGRQVEITVEVGRHRIALVTPRAGVEPDELVTISVPPHRILLFDAATGERILIAPAAEAGAGAGQLAEAGHHG